MRRLLAALLVICTALGLNLAVSTPAAAGDCPIPLCGGVFYNDSSRNVLVANCWDNDSIWAQEGHYLACQRNSDGSVRIGNVQNAAISLLAGDRTYYFRYSKYFDADAVRFPSGCVTRAHFSGQPSYDTDRRGLLPLWGRINNWHEFIIDSVTC
jgi:hypothetical protein